MKSKKVANLWYIFYRYNKTWYEKIKTVGNNRNIIRNFLAKFFFCIRYKLVCGREIGTFCQKIPNFGHTDTGGALQVQVWDRCRTSGADQWTLGTNCWGPGVPLLGPGVPLLGPGGPKTIYTTYCTVSVCIQVKWASN